MKNRSAFDLALWLICSGAVLGGPWLEAAESSFREIIVTNNLTLERDAQLSARFIVRANHVTIDGNGATLIGPGQIGDSKSLETAGIGILIDGATGVVLKNLKARGFASGLVVRHARALTVVGCDFSDNYHNPKHGWGEMPSRGGILVQDTRHCVFRNNRANRVWDALHLIESDDNLISDNDFSECSNTCAKLWKSSRNKFINNNLSHGIRIDRAAGEVHARDSTCVLMETGSDDNYWYRNDITHGGDGVFIRPLNRWVSRGNVFIENDTSFANNNCVESWSPGNIFIRNKANHGSYGFWLGGSDQTVLLGNEAAFNGLTNGYHNAPEPGFGHGGIVIVGGPSSHTLIQGNILHDNNGAGIAFRGDVGSKGRKWRTEHWVIQQNQITNNRFGIWGRWANGIALAANVITNNAQGNVIQEVEDFVELPPPATLAGTAPRAEIIGPEVVMAGQSARFDASRSRGADGRALGFQWWLDGKPSHGMLFEQKFEKPGFHCLSLTVNDGALASLAWRDLLVVQPVAQELGTETQASRWGFELEWNNQGRGRIVFEEDRGIVGRHSLKLTPNPYPGAYATAIFPGSRDAGWNFSGKTEIRFWIKAQNPNLPGWQNAGPVVRLLGRTGELEFKPVKDANLLNDPPFSEARWLWMPVRIPLSGDAAWQRATKGAVALDQIDAISLSLDSWGAEPFSVWLDGLTVD